MTTPCDAWNPGLDSDIPRHLLPLVTLFRQENGFVSYPEASELSDLTGIKLNSLVAFRPERLVIHALLVRVTANLSVADGPSYEELGLNLRGMVDTVYTRYMQPQMDAICRVYYDGKAQAEDLVSAQLAEKLYAPPKPVGEPEKKSSIFFKLFAKKPVEKQSSAVEEMLELRVVDEWNQLARNQESQLVVSCFETLAKTVSTIVGHRGTLRVDQQVVTKVVVNHVCNTYVADLIDAYIQPIFDNAVEQEGYRYLPKQLKPVIMNVKGASASGKSTIRPQQRRLAGKLDIPWEDFALISPDYWRKYLLEYESLGDDYKYGAMLTGTELEIIDKKLDRYMATKASEGSISHLLIDRFRFDSFTVDIDKSPDSKLLSRFGDQVFMFFMITPPAATVERAWLRGINTGRYKAVDDLLYHNVEAYTGMPSLFLSWVNSKDRKVHFEFLDNDVELGELPRTVAFGWNGTMTILDVNVMLNVDRYRQVDITAKQADQVFKKAEAGKPLSTDFIVQCAKTVKQLDFADPNSLNIYASVSNGDLIWWDDEYLQTKAGDSALYSVLSALGFEGEQCASSLDGRSAKVDQAKEGQFLVGQFG